MLKSTKMKTDSARVMAIRGNATMPDAHVRSVAVVIPTYNRVKEVRRAIASVRSQTYAIDEIVVVDDGSTDGTVDALSSDRQRPNLRVVCQSNAGANAARNRGINLVQAEWVAFLDSDDEWRPTKIEEQVKRLEINPVAVAAFTGLDVRSPMGARTYDPGIDRATVRSIRGSNVLGSTSTAIVRRDVLAACGGFDEGLQACQDWDLWLRVLSHGPGEVLRSPLTVYSDQPASRISTDLQRVIDGHRAVFTKILAGVGKREAWALSARHDLLLAEILAYRAKTYSPAAIGLARSLRWPVAPFRTLRLAAVIARRGVLPWITRAA